MSLDTLIKNDLVNFRQEIIKSLKEQHSNIFLVLERIFSGHKNMVGMQVMENGKLAEKYTFVMDGINVVEVKSGVLASEIHRPFLGVVKPYITVERNTIETLVKDESFKSDIFSSMSRYLPALTIQFMP